ncbi:hypothetical protein BD770DRAFT_463822 [Pilaira anomala]|nr:hypothetical protein BD770DRAFT_463822 [Pilaira anomala]
MYTNWDEKASLIHPYFWISVRDLTTYLHDLRRYIIETPAKMSETHAPKLPERLVPANKNEQFPAETTFLCEGHNEWKLQLDKLQLAVSVMINSNKLIRNYPDFKTAGEVEIFALERINYLLQYLKDEQDCILDRAGFEKLYGLVWDNQ